MSFCVSLFDPPITVPPALHGHESTKAWKYQAETLKWVPPSSEVPLTITPRKLKRAAAKAPHSKFWRSHQRPLHWNVLMKWCNSGKSEPLATKKKCYPKKFSHLLSRKLNQLSGANKLKHIKTWMRYNDPSNHRQKRVINQHLQSKVTFRSRWQDLSILTVPKFNQLCSTKWTIYFLDKEPNKWTVF